MSLLSRTKRYLKHHLPEPLVSSINAVRRLWYRENPRVRQDRLRFEALNPSSTSDRIVVRPGIELRIHPETRAVFEWFCWRSPPMVDEFDALLRLREGRRTLLDIGASHGVYSLGFTAGRPEATAIAIEPSPLAFPILQRNAELNAPDRIRCVQVAAGDRDGELRMRVNWHHLEVIPDQSATDDDQVKVVPVRPIDAVCAELGCEPDLIKVDVEGFELQCLQGLSSTLRRLRPIVILEVHPALIRPMGYTERQIVDLMDDAGYNFHRLDGERVDRGFVEDQEYTSWYACHPRERPPT